MQVKDEKVKWWFLQGEMIRHGTLGPVEDKCHSGNSQGREWINKQNIGEYMKHPVTASAT